MLLALQADIYAVTPLQVWDCRSLERDVTFHSRLTYSSQVSAIAKTWPWVLLGGGALNAIPLQGQLYSSARRFWDMQNQAGGSW